MTTTYNDDQIKFLTEKYEEGLSWQEITNAFNIKYSTKRTLEGLRKTYARYKDVFAKNDDDLIINAREVWRNRKRSNYLNKQRNVILESWEVEDDILTKMQNMIEGMELETPEIYDVDYDENKPNCIIEPLFSDLHTGKKTKKISVKKLERRISKYADEIINLIQVKQNTFNVQKIIIPLLGDIIENAIFHGVESQKSSEVGTSEQIVLSIKFIFFKFLVKLYSLGIPIEIKAVCGNHDRTGKDKTYVKPGRDNLTWVIYNMLQELTTAYGYDHVKFDIAEDNFTHANIYGSTVVYEHLDEVKKSENAVKNHMNARSAQLKKFVDYIRGGHFHSGAILFAGRIVFNGSFCGQDDFAINKGYHAVAHQVVNVYIDRKGNPYEGSITITLE